MEDSAKKPIMIGVIVVCLLVAGLITYFTQFRKSGGLSGISSGEMMWVKCANKACNAEYQMARKDYFEALQKKADPFARTTPPLTCNKCQQESLYAAEKCQNPQCGIVFISGTIRGDFADRCPKCKQSATEESRKKALSEQGR